MVRPRVRLGRLHGLLLRARTLTLGVSLGCSLGLGPAAGRAHATDDGPVPEHLRVRPGVTCLSAGAVAAQVERWLGDTPVPTDVTVVVEGSVYAPRYVRLYVIRGRTTVARRAFEPGPDDCGELHAAIGLSVALALKASVPDPAPPTPASPATPEPSPERPRAQGAPPWALSASGLVSGRLLPGLAPGVAAGVRYGPVEPISLRLAALGVRAPGVDLAGQIGRFDATLLGLRLGACATHALVGPLRGAICVGALGGALHATGVGVPMPGSATVPLLALDAGALLALRLSRTWSVELEVSLIVLLHRVRVGVAMGSDPTEGPGRNLGNPGVLAGLGPVFHFQ